MRAVGERPEVHRLRALIVLLWRAGLRISHWAWDQLDPWLEIRQGLPIGAVLCVIHGPTAGRRWEASVAHKQRLGDHQHRLRPAVADDPSKHGTPLPPLTHCPGRNDRSVELDG